MEADHRVVIVGLTFVISEDMHKAWASPWGESGMKTSTKLCQARNRERQWGKWLNAWILELKLLGEA